MKKSIGIKLFICIALITIILTTFCLPVSHAIGNIFSAGQGFLLEGETIENTIDTTQLKNTSDYIYNVLLAIGIMVAVIVAMILGIEFMVASADEKAKVKEALLPFIVGCIVVFGAFTIWKIVVNSGFSAESGEGTHITDPTRSQFDSSIGPSNPEQDNPIDPEDPNNPGSATAPNDPTDPEEPSDPPETTVDPSTAPTDPTEPTS